MSRAAFPELPQADEYKQAISDAITPRVTGSVNAIVGNRVEVRGLNAPVGSVCRIRTRSGQQGAAKVIGFRDDSPIVSAMDELAGLSSGDPVQLVSRSVNVRLGQGLIGRVVDALGRPIDGRPLPMSLTPTSVNMKPPESLDRPPIDTVFETGIRAIDGLLTCGRDSDWESSRLRVLGRVP